MAKLGKVCAGLEGGEEMWEDYEETRADRPHLWLAFIVILLLLSSIFIFRPHIGARPSAGELSSVGGMVSTTVDQTEHGRPVLAKGVASGMWAVHAIPADGRHLVRFLSARGDEQWADVAGFAEVVTGTQGNFLVIAGLGQSRVYVYHARHRLVSALNVPGEVQGVAVSGQGEVLVTFTVANAEPLTLRTEVAKYSSQGQQIWRHSLHNELPLLVEQSADGGISAVVNLVLGSRVGAKLTVLGRHGEPLFGAEISGQPRHLLVHHQGESVVVGTADGLRVFAKDGQEISSYNSPGALTVLQFVGEQGDLFFSADSRSIINWRQQSIVGLLRGGDNLVWRERIRERVLFVSAAETSRYVLVGTAQSIAVYSQEGEVRFSTSQTFGEDYLAITPEGTNVLVLSSTGQVVQLRGE